MEALQMEPSVMEPAARAHVWRHDGEGFALPFRAGVLSVDGDRSLRVAGWLTAYDAETIAMLAMRMGPGTRIEFTLAPRASERSISWVREQFAYLDARGIEVSVERATPGRSV